MSTESSTLDPLRPPRPPKEPSDLRSLAAMLPAAVLLGLFFVVPLGLVIAYSFWRIEDYEIVKDLTLENYDYLLSVPTYISTAVATFWISAVATALTVGLALPLAYWLVRYVPSRWQKLVLALVVLPFLTSYLLRVYAWITILGERGAINRFLQWSGVTDEPLSLFLYNRPGVILVLVYLYFPFAVLTLYATLDRFDWRQLTAARDLGASASTAIRTVLLAQIRPGLVAATVFVFIPIFGEYLTPQLVGGTRGVMFGNLIANFFQGAQYARGAAAALLVAAIVLLLLLVFRRSLELRGGPVGLGATGPDTLVSRHGPLARRLLGAYAGVIFVFLFAPILLLVLFSFNANRFGTFPITGWTLDWYTEVLSDPGIQGALWTSLRVAAEVTVVSTVIGTAAAFPLARAAFPFRNVVRVLFTLPIMIPGLLIGVSLLVLLTSALQVQLSVQTAVLGQSVFITPFVVLIVAARLQTLDRSLDRAAADLGAGTFNRLRFVILPLAAPAIFAAALIAFTLSLDEFIITFFLIGGENTLPIYIFTQTKTGITPEVNALAALLLAASIALFSLAAVIPALLKHTRRLVARRSDVSHAA